MLLSTRSLAGYSLDKAFALAKQGGCSGIDLSVDFSLYDTINANYLNLLVTRHNIHIKSITAPERRMTRKQVEMVLTLADDIGVSMVNLHPPHRSDREKDWFGEGLATLITKHPKLIVNIVNAPPKTWLFVISEYGNARPETIKKITGHTALSITHVDPESGVDLMKTFTLMGSTITLTYLADKNEDSDGMFPGEGCMPLESLLIRMREAGYTGEFTLDVDPRTLGAGDDEAVVRNIEKAEKYLAKYFG